MKLTDERSGLKITKNKRCCAIKGDTYDSFNRRTVANIRRTENAVMDCPQCLYAPLTSDECHASSKLYGSRPARKAWLVQI